MGRKGLQEAPITLLQLVQPPALAPVVPSLVALGCETLAQSPKCVCGLSRKSAPPGKPIPEPCSCSQASTSESFLQEPTPGFPSALPGAPVPLAASDSLTGPFPEMPHPQAPTALSAHLLLEGPSQKAAPQASGLRV